MQNYRILEESIVYIAGTYNCELQFIRCTEPEKKYHLYDLELIVDGANQLDLYKQSIGETEGTFKISGLRKIIPATIEALDDWCNRHPNTFISFFDCLSGYRFLRIYNKLGFVHDGRIDTFVAFVDEQGKRIAFKGMLNLLAEDDFWVNDLWRVAKDFDYYLGTLYTVVDQIRDILSTPALYPQTTIEEYCGEFTRETQDKYMKKLRNWFYTYKTIGDFSEFEQVKTLVELRLEQYEPFVKELNQIRVRDRIIKTLNQIIAIRKP